MCLHCLPSPAISFGDKLGKNLTEILPISYDNCKVIVQSLCYLHDLLILIARCPYDDLAEVTRSRYINVLLIMVEPKTKGGKGKPLEPPMIWWYETQ